MITITETEAQDFYDMLLDHAKEFAPYDNIAMVDLLRNIADDFENMCHTKFSEE